MIEFKPNKWQEKVINEDWSICIVIGSKGIGKTMCLSQFILERVRQGSKRIGIVGADNAHIKDISLFGQSGICTIDSDAIYDEKRKEIKWNSYANTVAKIYQSTRPLGLHGPEHDTIIIDDFDLCENQCDVFTYCRHGLRLNNNPRMVVTMSGIATINDWLKYSIYTIKETFKIIYCCREFSTLIKLEPIGENV